MTTISFPPMTHSSSYSLSNMIAAANDNNMLTAAAAPYTHQQASSQQLCDGGMEQQQQQHMYVCRTHSVTGCISCQPIGAAAYLSSSMTIQYNKRLVCYVPVHSEGTVSCVLEDGLAKSVMTTDKTLATIPLDAIIDSVEYFGIGGFATKDTFSIGLGQLNQGLMFPLIEDATSEIANERNGGCKQFLSYRMDGRNDRCIVLYESNVNVVFNQPVTNGSLMIAVYYHMKPI